MPRVKTLGMLNFSKMIHMCSIGAIFTIFLAPPASFAKTIPADSDKISYEGRVYKEDKLVHLGYPGTVARIKFKGSRLDMSYHSNSDHLWLDIIVDGEEAKRILLPQGRHITNLFNGKHGTHQVEIHKRVESWQAIWQIISFSSEKGKFYRPEELPERKILVIGDSIAAGASVDIRPGDEAHGKHNSNGRLSFGCVLARQLNAQCHLVAYGGRGLTRDWEGKTEINNAPVFYERALADSSNNQWDHSRYQPQVVIIELGQNDFNQGMPDEKLFVGEYVKLVEKIKADIPNVPIIIMESPMHGANVLERKVLSHYLDAVVEAFNSKGVIKHSVSHYPGRPGVDAHPIASEHVEMAKELLPTVKRVTNWE